MVNHACMTEGHRFVTFTFYLPFLLSLSSSHSFFLFLSHFLSCYLFVYIPFSFSCYPFLSISILLLSSSIYILPTASNFSLPQLFLCSRKQMKIVVWPLERWKCSLWSTQAEIVLVYHLPTHSFSHIFYAKCFFLHIEEILVNILAFNLEIELCTENLITNKMHVLIFGTSLYLKCRKFVIT